MKKVIPVIVVAICFLLMVFFAYVLFFNKNIIENKVSSDNLVPANEQVQQNDAYNESLQKILKQVDGEFMTNVKNKLEDWSEYILDKNSSFAPYQQDPGCKAIDSWVDYYQRAKTGPVYRLNLLYGLYLEYTLNYEHWTAHQLLSFTDQDAGVCGVGGPLPVYAYSDKVLWLDGYCGGAGGSQCDENYELQNLIGNYFKEKTK